jgi:carbon storage regulator
MLVLTRKPGEKVVIGNGITVTVVEVAGNRVRIGIEAPHPVRIRRSELEFWQEEPLGFDEPADPACHVESKTSGGHGEGTSRASPEAEGGS